MVAAPEFAFDLVLVGPERLADLDGVAPLRWPDRADVLRKAGDLLLRVLARRMQIDRALRQPATAAHHRTELRAPGQSLLGAGDDVADRPAVLLDAEHLFRPGRIGLPVESFSRPRPP